MYLKDIVKQSGGTLHLKIESIGSAQQLMSKAGTPYEVKPVTFTIPATGKQIIESVYATTFDFDLNGVTAGMHVEASIKQTKKGKEVVAYKVLKSDAETAYTAPSQTPQKQVQAERAASEHIDAQAEKSIAICLQGFMQAFITGNYASLHEGESITPEKLIPLSVDFAAQARKALLAKAKEIYTQETFAQD